MTPLDPTPAGTRNETVGLDPKLPVQALATLLVAVIAYFGVELDAEVSAAISVLLGAVAAYFAPAAATKLVPS